MVDKAINRKLEREDLKKIVEIVQEEFQQKNYYMGFERDLVYREYVLEQEYLSYVNFIFLAIFWGVFSFFAFQKLLCKYSLYRAFNVFVFIFLLFFAVLAFSIDPPVLWPAVARLLPRCCVPAWPEWRCRPRIRPQPRQCLPYPMHRGQ